jgi:HK97 family phage portal protein
MGLFQKIFGKDNSPQVNTQGVYKLLNTWQSSFVPFSGNAYDVNTVRAAVDAFARRVAKVQPRHIRRTGDVIETVRDKYDRLLRLQPNPYTTAYKFYYRIATQYKLYNNAFVFPVWDAYNGELEALYNINASSIELVDCKDELFVRMSFANGNKYVCPYTDLLHIGTHFNNNDVFGENNRPINAVLETANTFNQSMAKSAELVSMIRGILEINDVTKDGDLKFQRERFIDDNLKFENNGSGVIVNDNKHKYTPITDKQTPIPTGQLAFVKGEIYDYFGANEKIIQNKETPEEAEAYYNGEIEPFYEQMTQTFSSGLFTARELGYGNEIIFEGDTLQNTKISEKTAALKFLADIGGLTVDQALIAYGLAPIGGEEGKRRVQTLNMVNAKKADKYQLGDDDPDDDPDDSADDNNNEEE